MKVKNVFFLLVISAVFFSYSGQVQSQSKGEKNMKNIAEYTLHTKESAPKASGEMLGKAEQQFGFVPNILRQMAEAPSAFQGDLQLLDAFEKSSLTLAERWVILLVVSGQCEANYCVAANSTIAKMLGVSADIVESVRKGESLPDAKLEALRIFTDEMVRNRGMASRETQERFFEAGFTKENVFDVILGIALETMASYTARITGTPMDEQFKENE